MRVCVCRCVGGDGPHVHTHAHTPTPTPVTMRLRGHTLETEEAAHGVHSVRQRAQAMKTHRRAQKQKKKQQQIKRERLGKRKRGPVAKTHRYSSPSFFI